MAESEKELDMVSETIMSRIMPIVNLFDSIEGLEEFLKQFESKKTKMSSKLKEDLTKQLEEAGKKRDEHIAKKFEFYTRGLERPRKKPKGQAKTG